MLIIITCTCLGLSGCGIPKHVRKAFTYCYTDTYTGIDTLINIDGYHFNSMIFYDNGLVVNLIYGYAEQTTPLLLKKIIKNPEAKDSKSFYSFNDCGSYKICGDTIKVQMLHNYHSLNDDWGGREEWYRIIDKNTLHFLDWFLITTNQKEQELFRKRYKFPSSGGAKVPFMPVSTKPPSDYYWILKEKWFWCNEEDWKEYMDSLKATKKRK